MFNEVRDETDAASMLKQLLNLNAKETNKFKLNFLHIETEKPTSNLKFGLCRER